MSNEHRVKSFRVDIGGSPLWQQFADEAGASNGVRGEPIAGRVTVFGSEQDDDCDEGCTGEVGSNDCATASDAIPAASRSPDLSPHGGGCDRRRVRSTLRLCVFYRARSETRSKLVASISKM